LNADALQIENHDRKIGYIKSETKMTFFIHLKNEQFINFILTIDSDFDNFLTVEISILYIKT
jgi:hypothetical protein